MSKEGVQDIINIFTKENVEICFVGGCIRDVLAGIQSHDIDFAINCCPNSPVTTRTAPVPLEDLG